MSAPKAVLGQDYARHVSLHATRERVFDAITTIPGLQGWWTNLVTGSSKPGSELSFDFDGLKEHIIVMRVDEAKCPSSIHWTCVRHMALPEWDGTKVTFELTASGPQETELSFRHIGLTPKFECYDMCRNGWDYFLDSLVAYVELGTGTPFGTGRRVSKKATHEANTG